MGQLEVYNINETILSSLVANIANNYISESHESSTFESFKAYFYSSNIIFTKKLRKQGMALSAQAVTTNNGIFKSRHFLNFTNNSTIRLTKLIDDFDIWQDKTTIDTKIDENIVKLQKKYNLE